MSACVTALCREVPIPVAVPVYGAKSDNRNPPIENMMVSDLSTNSGKADEFGSVTCLCSLGYRRHYRRRCTG